MPADRPDHGQGDRRPARQDQDGQVRRGEGAAADQDGAAEPGHESHARHREAHHGQDEGHAQRVQRLRR